MMRNVACRLPAYISRLSYNLCGVSLSLSLSKENAWLAVVKTQTTYNYQTSINQAAISYSTKAHTRLVRMNRIDDVLASVNVPPRRLAKIATAHTVHVGT